MIPIKGEVRGVRETISAVAGIPSLLRQAAMGAMTESLQLFSKTVRDDFLRGPYPQEIERRTGSFRATFARGHADNIWQVQASGSTVTGTFGSKDKRARILNDGGTIRPVRSQFLAIRTEFTKTPRGVVREKYQQPLRNVPNTFVRMRDATHGTVFERIGRRIIPIAWLVKEVHIVGRNFMSKTQKVVEPLLPAIFQKRFDTILTRLQDTLRRIG